MHAVFLPRLLIDGQVKEALETALERGENNAALHTRTYVPCVIAQDIPNTTDKL